MAGRTPLLRGLFKVASDVASAARRDMPVEDLLDRRQRAVEKGDLPVSRRQLLLGAAALGASLALPRVARAKEDEQPSIAIVGAGLAGLTASLHLADRGLASTVYESSGRIGGRMFSNSGRVPGSPQYWYDNQVTEWCGELLDSDHKRMFQLAARFNLPIDDLTSTDPAGVKEVYRFGDRYYPREKATRDFVEKLWPRLEEEIHRIGHTTPSYRTGRSNRSRRRGLPDKSKQRVLELDHMSVQDWLKQVGVYDTDLGQLIDKAYNIEFGAELADQSALDLIEEMASQTDPNDFGMFGASNERFHIRGGNQLLPVTIAKYLETRHRQPVQFGNRLRRIARNGDGKYTLSFDGPAGTKVVDYAILAIPFAVLRTIDFSAAEFDALKTTAIREQGAGKNAKLQLQFTKPLWNEKGPWGVGSGTTYSDTGYQCSWSPSRGQRDPATGKPGSHAIINNYRGGAAAAALGTKAFTKDAFDPARLFLGQFEPVFPGVSKLFAGKATLSIPHLDPNFNCAYSYYRVGQVTKILGYEQVRQKNCLFAGEHTSVEFGGFMEGAAESGERVAGEILKDLGHHAGAPSNTPGAVGSVPR